MSAFVLVMWMWGSRSPVETITHDFTSKESCESAYELIIQKRPNTKSDHICVPK